MTCQEALDLIYDIIDKEAANIDAEEVRAHLKKCSDCSSVFKLEQSVNAFIQEKLNNPDPTPRLETLKSRLLTELDEIDLGDCTKSDPVREKIQAGNQSFLSFGRIIALAASLIIVIGVGYFSRSAVDHHALFIPIEQAHWQVADNLDSYRNLTKTASVVTDLSNSTDLEMLPELSKFKLVGGKTESVDGASMTHFVYEYEQETVSIFVADASVFSIPENLTEAVTIRDGVVLFYHNCRGCRLVYKKSGNSIIIYASTDRELDLVGLARMRSSI